MSLSKLLPLSESVLSYVKGGETLYYITEPWASQAVESTEARQGKPVASGCLNVNRAVLAQY